MGEGQVNPVSSTGTMFFPAMAALSYSILTQSSGEEHLSRPPSGRMMTKSLQESMTSKSWVLNFPDRRDSMSMKTLYPALLRWEATSCAKSDALRR